MLDIWEIYNYIQPTLSVAIKLFKGKPAEWLTALLLLIGLLLDRFYRKKRLVIEVVSYNNHSQENIDKELIFRIINNGSKEIHLRSKGVVTFNTLKLDHHDAYTQLNGYHYLIYDDEETLLPGKSIRTEVLEWKSHKTGGIAYIYVVDQTGKKWKSFLHLSVEIRYYFLKVKNFLRNVFN